MKHSLSNTEKECLLSYRVSFEKKEADELTIPLQSLLDYDKLQAYVDKVQQRINAPSKKVAASILAKRLGYLFAVPVLYSLALFNKRINCSPENVMVEPSAKEEQWLPEIYFADQEVEVIEAGAERDEVRQQLVQSLFADCLNIIWDQLADIGKISKQTLWENTAIYVFWIYESLLKEDLSAEIRNRVIDDFHFVLLKAEGNLFGDYKRNPLIRFYTDYTIRNGEKIRVRKTCCFSYELPEGKMCKTCPKNC